MPHTECGYLIKMKLLPEVKYRSSEWVDYIVPNIKKGECELCTRNGDRYLYKNVSRRAMANLKLNQNMSFGFWANQNLVNSDRTTFEYLDCKEWADNVDEPSDEDMMSAFGTKWHDGL